MNEDKASSASFFQRPGDHGLELWLKKSVWEFWSLYEKCLGGNTSTALFVFTVTLDSKVKLAAKFLEVRHCFMFLSRSINCKAKKKSLETISFQKGFSEQSKPIFL